MVTLQEFVNEYVVNNNTTKEALAKSADIGRTSFFSKIRGASEFSLSEAYRLSSIIGCSIDDLYSMTLVGQTD